MRSRQPAESTLPFWRRPWPAALQDCAAAIWSWHQSLATVDLTTFEHEDMNAFLASEAASVTVAAPLHIVPDDIWQPVYACCRNHRLSRELLAQQLLALPQLEAPVRFEDRGAYNLFVDRWVVPHARLLAGLADADHRWQATALSALARAFYSTRRLVRLADDLMADKVFLPLSDIELAGTTVDALKTGPINGAIRRLLWREIIRTRDAYATGMPLVHDLPRRYASELKRLWLGGLELLNEIERRDFDLWTRPIGLSTYRRAHVRFQSRFGRATFRKT